MLKNNKGITILALIITILVLLVLTSVSLGTGYSVITDIKLGRTVANMALVKAKAETIYEQSQFSGNEEDLVGEKVSVDFLSQEEIQLIEQNAGKTGLAGRVWYKWDAETLAKQGLDPSLIQNLIQNKKEDFYFLVNYEFDEVAWNNGTTYDVGTEKTYYYSMTGLNWIYKNRYND